MRTLMIGILLMSVLVSLGPSASASDCEWTTTPVATLRECQESNGPCDEGQVAQERDETDVFVGAAGFTFVTLFAYDGCASGDGYEHDVTNVGACAIAVAASACVVGFSVEPTGETPAEPQCGAVLVVSPVTGVSVPVPAPANQACSGI